MSPKSSTSSRVSREEAERKLIASLIELLGEKQISEITVDLIADSAGLKSGHVLVHRYFESRAGLVAAAAHHLSTVVTHQIIDDLDALSDTSPATVLPVIANSVENLRRRAILIAELMTTGADPSMHAVDSRGILDALAKCFQAVGLAPRTARATALKIFSLVIMESTHVDWMGSTPAEAEDLRNMVLYEIVNATNVTQQMGWS